MRFSVVFNAGFAETTFIGGGKFKINTGNKRILFKEKNSMAGYIFPDPKFNNK